MGRKLEIIKFKKSISLFCFFVLYQRPTMESNDAEFALDLLDHMYKHLFTPNAYRAWLEVVALEQQIDQAIINGTLKYEDTVDLRKGPWLKFVDAIEKGVPTDILSDAEYDAIKEESSRAREAIEENSKLLF